MCVRKLYISDLYMLSLKMAETRNKKVYLNMVLEVRIEKVQKQGAAFTVKE